MNSALYIGATGMKGLSQGMQVTTNNLANVSTIGYKQQNTLFSDMLSTSQGGTGDWWNAQENSRVALGQTGKGVQVDAVRTIFQQGALEATNTVTDMAINGKGFFQVSDGANLYYTRAGDFRPDNEGVWRTPTGLALNGYQYNTDGSLGGLQEVKIDRFGTMPAKSTARVDLTLNLNSNQNKTEDADNPYFGLLGLYNAAGKPPLSSDSYAYSQAMTLYDADGKARTVTAYFDGTPDSTAGSMIEFVIAAGSGRGQDRCGRQPRSALGGRRPADERRSAIRRLGPVDRACPPSRPRWKAAKILRTGSPPSWKAVCPSSIWTARP